ncbi:MAG: ABC transporter substrate-binding protein [Firmicutes bacterium]|nr:ABC transporter substrate-binding protein [Bacillota bacterium]
MRKNVFLLLLPVCFLAALLFSGCAADREKQQQTRTVIDQRGKEIVIPRQVERIVAFHAPVAAIIPALDGTGERLAGMHPIAMRAISDGMLGEIYPELKEVPTELIRGGLFAPNVEELLKLNPDVVFQICDAGEEIIKPMEDVGIPVIGVTGVSAEQEELEEWIELAGKVLGKEEKAAALADYHRVEIEQLVERLGSLTERPRVLFVRSMDGVTTVGGMGGGFYQWRFELTGAENVAAALPAKIQAVNNEQVMEWNPDIIYVENRTGLGDLTSESILNNQFQGWHWRGISAVDSGRVYEVPLGGFYWAPQSHEAPLMWKWMAGIQHPGEVDFSLRDDIKDFYHKFYDYSLSEAQLDQILRCDKPGNKNLPYCRD